MSSHHPLRAWNQLLLLLSTTESNFNGVVAAVVAGRAAAGVAASCFATAAGTAAPSFFKARGWFALIFTAWIDRKRAAKERHTADRHRLDVENMRACGRACATNQVRSRCCCCVLARSSHGFEKELCTTPTTTTCACFVWMPPREDQVGNLLCSTYKHTYKPPRGGS